MQDGWLSGHPYNIIPGGLDGVKEGLESLRDGKASASRYVYGIGEMGDVDKARPRWGN